MIFRDEERESFEQELESFIEAKGFKLVSLQIIKRNKNTNFKIAVYNENGVTIDDCAKISKALDVDFELENKYGENYTIEVSSPGIARRLKTIKEYKIFIGKKVEIFLLKEDKKTEKITAIIKSIDNDLIKFSIEDGSELKVNFADIKKGRLVPDIK